jgi:hypothetical protein
MALAGVAEWLGTGLQSRLRGFESRHSLAWGISSGVEPYRVPYCIRTPKAVITDDW